MKDFAKKLIDWHQQHGRKGLPWQGLKDPYKVWLSEIMLQQTQVATVIDRYQTFLIKFPNVQSLAQAPLDEVMALWAGLGYYTRARNLHACAKMIVAQYAGQFPQLPEQLNQLPGIGQSTARAIAAFCFNHPASILDANVQRLIARTHGIRGSLKTRAENQKLWILADNLLPKDAQLMPTYTQALMDFGATVCKPTSPACQNKFSSSCIYLADCLAFKDQTVLQIPLKIKKVPSKIVVSEMLLMMDEENILLEKRPHSGIWGGLWTLPETPWVEIKSEKEVSQVEFKIDQFHPLISLANPSAYQQGRVLAPHKHVFTHRTLYFSTRIVKVSKTEVEWNDACHWIKLSELASIGLPTPVKKLLEDFQLLDRV